MTTWIRTSLTLALVLAGCSEGASQITVDPDDIEPGCAGHTACLDTGVGFGVCSVVLAGAGHWDTRGMSLSIGTVGREDSIAVLAGVQNLDCVVEAGRDCDRVLACLNQGYTVRGCIPPPGHHAGRYCREDDVLSACVPFGPGGETVELSFICADIGQRCVEMQREDDVFAGCGFPAPGSGQGVTVTCEGTLAKVTQHGASFYWECANQNARCVPGTYRFEDDYPFCQRDGPACDPETLVSYCDGDRMVDWCNGTEVGFDCTSQAQVCKVTRILMWEMPFCTYDTDCHPYSFEERCRDGVVTYCGPEGVTELDCTTLGFSGCAVNLFYARCVQ